MQIFLGLQCLVDGYNIFDKWIGNLDIEKNTFLGTIFYRFFLKICYE